MDESGRAEATCRRNTEGRSVGGGSGDETRREERSRRGETYNNWAVLGDCLRNNRNPMLIAFADGFAVGVLNLIELRAATLNLRTL